jgi:hypothetical protein
VEAWVQKVINDMKVAAELDREANMEKRPGTNKLKLLPLVSEELRMCVGGKICMVLCCTERCCLM